MCATDAAASATNDDRRRGVGDAAPPPSAIDAPRDPLPEFADPVSASSVVEAPALFSVFGTGALCQVFSALVFRRASRLVDFLPEVDAREKLPNHDAFLVSGLVNSSLMLTRSGRPPSLLGAFLPSTFHAFSTFSLCFRDASRALSSPVSLSDALPPPPPLPLAFNPSAAAAAATLSAALATGLRRTSLKKG